MTTVDEAWKALIVTALRRNVVVAVGEHRPIIEAVILRDCEGVRYTAFEAAIQESRAGGILMGVDPGYPMTGAGETAAGRRFLADHPEHARAIAAIEDESRAGGGLAEGGTTTECPIEGVHEHAFRGPHRFHEWEPGS